MILLETFRRLKEKSQKPLPLGRIEDRGKIQKSHELEKENRKNVCRDIGERLHMKKLIL